MSYLPARLDELKACVWKITVYLEHRARQSRLVEFPGPGQQGIASRDGGRRRDAARRWQLKCYRENRDRRPRLGHCATEQNGRGGVFTRPDRAAARLVESERPAMIYYALAGFALVMLAAFVRGTRDKYPDFCVGVSMPLFLLFGLPLVPLTGWVRPVTFDLMLRRWDLALGLDGFALTRWLGREHLSGLVGPVYCALPLMIALVWILTRSQTFIRGVAAVAFLVIPCYLLLPAAGPRYAFAGYPDASATIHQVWTMYPRNCFPSGHFSWALLLALAVRGRWRPVFVIYAGMMALATVASGEHYFVDVIAAVPFVLGIRWATSAATWRRITSRPAAAQNPEKAIPALDNPLCNI
jgi:hypothetical protein